MFSLICALLLEGVFFGALAAPISVPLIIIVVVLVMGGHSSKE